ncbi:condensation domain-containing protein [Paenibacillus glufosinatiresistens]|uniref:condensation domain-containing protein n=1 Tax=Paenibacillus glufosinatiresistens TaxID=3070657 RepID=UPI00286E5CC2|nr:condensation domain-containing protein [Paenibacillus sp. YX.27]
MFKPASDNEARILAACLENRGAYNIPLFIRFGQGLDLPRMYSLLNLYFEQLEIFRTSFRFSEENGSGRFFRQVREACPLIEIRVFDKLDKDRVAAERLIAVEDEEWVRALLCRSAEDEADYLFLNLHHALFDGFSVRLFLEDLLQAYYGEADKPSSLTSLTPAARQEAALGTPVSAAAESAGASEEAEPDFGGYSRFREALAGKRSRAAAAGVSRQLEIPYRRGEGRRYSDFTLVLSAFAVSVAGWLGTSGAYLAYPALGRSPAQYRTLGSFARLIPFHQEFGAGESLEPGLAEIQRRTLAAGRGESAAGFAGEAMDRLNIYRDLVFDYKSGSLISKVLDAAREVTLEEAEGYRDEKYGLHFSVYHDTAGQSLQLTVQSAEYGEEELDLLTGSFARTVQALCRDDWEAAAEPLRTAAARQASVPAAPASAPVNPAAPPDEPAERPLADSGLSGRVGRIVSELIGEEKVPAAESFFDLGMDSTLLVKFKKRVRETFNVNLKISDFFNYYTSDLLSQKIMDSLKEAN